MKVLVYGAGVIGSYLTHVLCRAGHEVTITARGEWKKTLEAQGLVIHHRLQRKTTTDFPTVIETVDPSLPYDVVFAVMQHQQLWAILNDLAALNTSRVVLVGNNLSASKMEEEILHRSSVPKTVFFGFQGTAGTRETTYLECVRWNGGELTVGGLHRALTEEEKNFFTTLFAGTKYRLRWEEDMESWYRCHLALILPIAYLCYRTGCDLRKATRVQRKRLLDAAGEGYALLQHIGVPIRPAGEEAYYGSGKKRFIGAAMMFVIEKTSLGKLCASDHCRHAVAEMESLDKAWMELCAQAPDFPMPNWNALRVMMPRWKTLYQIYRDDRK
jgi:2-dehydropantoate 2-reductase